jgi:hypothetical protein
MASENRSYTQFEDSHVPAPHYGTTTAPAGGQAAFTNDNEAKTLKKWKNSRRLCWALLVTSILTVLLEIIGAGISGTHLDWILGRFIAGVWLAALGVVSAALGLKAFKNPYESSKCWTVSHFVMCIVATVAYGILFLISIADVIGARAAIEAYHDEIDRIEDEEAETALKMSQNATAAANGTETIDIDYDPTPLLNAIKGDLTISVFLLGTTLAFFVLSIIANIIICRLWCRGGEKTMTIVYMPQDASGNPQTQSVVVPSKTQVVVIPAQKSGPLDQHQPPNRFT